MTTARERAVQARRGAGQKWWVPTPKWWTLLATSAATIVGSWIVTGAFDDVERGMAGTALLGLATTWAKSNEGKGG
jgi:hypothetical protein